jgi:biotin-dependent carboxylase-like uncharacterized protein
MSPSLRILKPGLMTTLQDFGRRGYQRLGVAVGGALDPVSLRAANALVGNAPGAGAIEVVYAGPAFVVEADSVQMACVGADASIEILPDENAAAGIQVAGMRTFTVQRGEVVRIGTLSRTAVLYLAIEGGFAVDPVLGSVSTYARGQLGGLNGRPLSAGDILPLALDHASDRGEFRLEGFSLSRPARFRAVLGPQDAFFTDAAKQQLFDGEYTVKVESDRMALQLSGPKLEHAGSFDIISDGIAMGSIQVPGHGQPIVLMADRQTTGGYPKIATVISADLPALGRARIGEKISFQAVSLEEAQHLRREHLREIERIPDYVVPLTRSFSELSEYLFSSNLISGAVSADWFPAAD